MSRPRAGFFRCLAAGLLDTALGLVLWGLCVMWLVLGLWTLRGLPRDLPALLLLYASALGLGLGLHLIYHVVVLGGCGQTVGRMALGIAVVRTDGRAPGLGRAALRFVGTFLTVLTLGLASLIALFNREGRDLADLLSGTRVVRLR